VVVRFVSFLSSSSSFKYSSLSPCVLYALAASFCLWGLWQWWHQMVVKFQQQALAVHQQGACWVPWFPCAMARSLNQNGLGDQPSFCCCGGSSSVVLGSDRHSMAAENDCYAGENCRKGSKKSMIFDTKNVEKHNPAITSDIHHLLDWRLISGWLLVVFCWKNDHILFISVWSNVSKCYLEIRMKINQVASIIRLIVQFEGEKDIPLLNACHFCTINLQYWKLHHCLGLRLYYFFMLVSLSTHVSVKCYQWHREQCHHGQSGWRKSKSDFIYHSF